MTYSRLCDESLVITRRRRILGIYTYTMTNVHARMVGCICAHAFAHRCLNAVEPAMLNADHLTACAVPGPMSAQMPERRRSLFLRTPNMRLAKSTMQRRRPIPQFHHELSKSTNCNSAKVWCSLHTGHAYVMVLVSDAPIVFI
eukprot:668276-Pleurochrysis_carterae.AAC.4